MRLPRSLKKIQQYLITILDTIIPSSVHPNTITLVGAVLNLIFLTLYAIGLLDIEHFLWLFLSTQLFDIFDGALARKRNLVSRGGQLLDTGVDMVSGIALCLVFITTTHLIQWTWFVLLIVLYSVRYYFVINNQDTEWGGYKNALTVGFLFAWYSYFDFTLIVQVVAIFNITSIIFTIKNNTKKPI